MKTSVGWKLLLSLHWVCYAMLMSTDVSQVGVALFPSFQHLLSLWEKDVAHSWECCTTSICLIIKKNNSFSKHSNFDQLWHSTNLWLKVATVLAESYCFSFIFQPISTAWLLLTSEVMISIIVMMNIFSSELYDVSREICRLLWVYNVAWVGNEHNRVEKRKYSSTDIMIIG